MKILFRRKKILYLCSFYYNEQNHNTFIRAKSFGQARRKIKSIYTGAKRIIVKNTSL